MNFLCCCTYSDDIMMTDCAAYGTHTLPAQSSAVADDEYEQVTTM